MTTKIPSPEERSASPPAPEQVFSPCQKLDFENSKSFELELDVKVSNGDFDCTFNSQKNPTIKQILRESARVWTVTRISPTMRLWFLVLTIIKKPRMTLPTLLNMEFMIFVDMKRRRNSEKSVKNVKFVKMSFPVQYLLPWLKLMIFGGTIMCRN